MSSAVLEMPSINSVYLPLLRTGVLVINLSPGREWGLQWGTHFASAEKNKWHGIVLEAPGARYGNSLQ
jgi:hypothetical protein